MSKITVVHLEIIPCAARRCGSRSLRRLLRGNICWKFSARRDDTDASGQVLQSGRNRGHVVCCFLPTARKTRAIVSRFATIGVALIRNPGESILDSKSLLQRLALQTGLQRRLDISLVDGAPGTDNMRHHKSVMPGILRSHRRRQCRHWWQKIIQDFCS